MGETFGTVIGELFASDQGLGFMLIRAMEAHKVLDIVALTLLLFAFAAIANGLLLVVERRVHRRSAAALAATRDRERKDTQPDDGVNSPID
jgi:ABC-type nitrate/sulfonate/bicarbonate transport system permease component